MRLDIMANLLIIGAGGVGSVVAHKCAQAAKYEQAFSSITLASRTRAKCDAIAPRRWPRTMYPNSAPCCAT